MTALLQRVADHGVTVDTGSVEPLLAYCRAVHEWSERSSLVSPNDLLEFVSKHVGTSLGPLLVTDVLPGAHWADIGTGAGLPGLVIKICRPEIEMTLVDSSRKKTIFLEEVRTRLNLNGLEILEARVEALDARPPQDTKRTGVEPVESPARAGGLYQVALMRAMAPLNRALPLIDGITGDGSLFVTFKGTGWKAEVEASRADMELYRWELIEARQIPWATPKVLLLKKRAEGH